MTQHPNRRRTQDSILVHALRDAVYRAFLKPDALASWLAPDAMRAEVHTLEPWVGGKFRMTLTYLNPQDAPSGRGKTSADADTSEGTFAELIPNEKIVWVVEFESPDPEFAGEMTMTWRFADANGATKVTVLCEGIPAGIRLEDNELGSQQSLRKLAAFVEGGN